MCLNPPECIHAKIPWDFFLCKNYLRKTRERELATLDEKPTSTRIAEPYARSLLKATTGGESGRHLWPRIVQKLKSRGVKNKQKTDNIEKLNMNATHIRVGLSGVPSWVNQKNELSSHVLMRCVCCRRYRRPRRTYRHGH